MEIFFPFELQFLKASFLHLWYAAVICYHSKMDMVPSTVITKQKTGPKVIKYGNSRPFFWKKNRLFSAPKRFYLEFQIQREKRVSNRFLSHWAVLLWFPKECVQEITYVSKKKKNWNASVYESRYKLYNRCLLFSLLEIQFRRRRVIKKNESTIFYIFLY